MGTETLNHTIVYNGWTFILRAVIFDEGRAVRALIDTPESEDWDPRGRSTDAAYPFDEVLRVIAEATGRRVEVQGGEPFGRHEVWDLRDLGEV